MIKLKILLTKNEETFQAVEEYVPNNKSNKNKNNYILAQKNVSY